jgi:predicted  nucleic acid-binding Zn-ribbon protein
VVLVKASPQAQLRLLDLAALDTELGRLNHRRRSLPEIAELENLTAQAAQAGDALVIAETELADMASEQTRAERDVDQVRARIEKDRQRLDEGKVSSARELESLQGEIQSLLRRQSDLEEVVLELMERRESIQSRRDELTATRDQLSAKIAAVTASRDAAFTEIDEAAGKASASRSQIAAQTPGDLLGLYDKLREQHGGLGAAALHRGRCQGCNLSLNSGDLAAIRAAALDEVLRCEECRRILVRTPESGL